jgi:hypothetical protein
MRRIADVAHEAAKGISKAAGHERVAVVGGLALRKRAASSFLSSFSLLGLLGTEWFLRKRKHLL